MNSKLATKTRTLRQAKYSAVLLLGLWCVILLGFFLIPLIAHRCHMTQDCPAEFFHQVKSFGATPWVIQFGFFFFLLTVCEICLPNRISVAVSPLKFMGIIPYLKVLSPPPRFAGC